MTIILAMLPVVGLAYFLGTRHGMSALGQQIQDAVTAAETAFAAVKAAYQAKIATQQATIDQQAATIADLQAGVPATEAQFLLTAVANLSDQISQTVP